MVRGAGHQIKALRIGAGRSPHPSLYATGGANTILSTEMFARIAGYDGSSRAASFHTTAMDPHNV